MCIGSPRVECIGRPCIHVLGGLAYWDIVGGDLARCSAGGREFGGVQCTDADENRHINFATSPKAQCLVQSESVLGIRVLTE